MPKTLSLEVDSITVVDGRQVKTVSPPKVSIHEKKDLYLGDGKYKVKIKDVTNLEYSDQTIVLTIAQKKGKKQRTFTIQQFAATTVIVETRWDELCKKLQACYQKFQGSAAARQKKEPTKRRTFGKHSQRSVVNRRFNQVDMDFGDDEEQAGENTTNNKKEDMKEMASRAESEHREANTVVEMVNDNGPEADPKSGGPSDMEVDDDTSSPIVPRGVATTSKKQKKVRKQPLKTKRAIQDDSDDDDVDFGSGKPSRKVIMDDDDDSEDDIPFNNMTTPATQTMVSPSTTSLTNRSKNDKSSKPASFDPALMRTPPREKSVSNGFNANRMLAASKSSKKRHKGLVESFLEKSPRRGVSPMQRRKEQLALGRKRNPEHDDPIDNYSSDNNSSNINAEVVRRRMVQRPRLLSSPGSKRLNFHAETHANERDGPPPRFRGLNNLGNTCYMNSSLQMLATCPSLVQKLRSHKGPLTASVSQIANQLLKFDQLSLGPRNVKKAIDEKTNKFSGYEQRDAHEFLSSTVDYIHDELEKEAKEAGRDLKATAFPTDDFCLTVKVCLTCTACGYSRSKEEMYRHLSIDIVGASESGESFKASVERGLDSFFRSEKREIKCEKCDEGTHAEQTLTILKRPEHLLLHLKRFIFVEKRTEIPVPAGPENESPNRPTQPQVEIEHVLKKNRSSVKIPENLSLSSYQGPKDKLSQDSEETTDWSLGYRLRSIVHHIGSRASSGHYTADAIRKDKDGGEVWVSFDDKSTEQTSLKKVSSSLFKQETAYMLLYSLEENESVVGDQGEAFSASRK